MGRLSCYSGLLPVCAHRRSLGNEMKISFSFDLKKNPKLNIVNLGIVEIKTEQCWRLLLSFKKYEFCVGNAGADFCRIFC